MKQRLLYFSPAASGGLASYAHMQARSLSEAGIQVTVLGYPGTYAELGSDYCKVIELPLRRFSRQRQLNRLHTACGILRHMRALKTLAASERHTHILFGAFTEYLAPLWAPSLRRLAQNGTVFGSILHDPKRTFVVGPESWHKYSIAQAYSFLRDVFTHTAIDRSECSIPSTVRLGVIPHGIYPLPPPSMARTEFRQSLGIPESAFLLLSFGHVRDYKNLDFVIRALPKLTEVHLLIAGSCNSIHDRPVAFYKRLSESLGVSARCHWLDYYLPLQEVSTCFSSSDLLVLNYASDFASASGVLFTAASAQLPCVAPDCQSPLSKIIDNYSLGALYPVNEQGSFVAAITERHRTAVQPKWHKFSEDHSWSQNANQVISMLYRE